MPGGFPPHTEHRGPVLITKPSYGRVPTALSKNRNPALPGYQETCFPKEQKGLVLPTVPDHGKTHSSTLNTKNAKFPTEGRKAVTYN
jgi:hypothetical protein